MPNENCFGHDKIRINLEKRVGYKRHSISATATKNETKKMPQEDPEERLYHVLAAFAAVLMNVLSCKRHETIPAPGPLADLVRATCPFFSFFFLECLRRLVITSPFQPQLHE